MILNQQNFYSLLIMLAGFLIAIDTCGQIPEGAQPAPTNIHPDDCPCLLPDGRVMFQVEAPDAGNVQVDLVGTLYDMQKDEAGVWTVTTDPQEAGFHYYSLVIDGFKVADPASESFYGMGKMASALIFRKREWIFIP
jgi:enterochelin esterase family protein